MTVYFPIFAPCRASCLAAFGGIVAWLQRVESVRVEKKIDKADIGNAAIVVCPGLERIVCYHDLLEGITGMPKREGLLFALFGGGEGIRRLDVDLPGTSIDDEVYLILSRLMDAVLAVIENHHADVHRISTPDEFAVDDIFHQMGRFCLPEVDPGISETGVGRVVLDRIIEIASSFDIVSRGFKNQECVLEAVEVLTMVGRVAFMPTDDWIMFVSLVGLVSPATLLITMLIMVSRRSASWSLLRSMMSLM